MNSSVSPIQPEAPTVGMSSSVSGWISLACRCLETARPRKLCGTRRVGHHLIGTSQRKALRVITAARCHPPRCISSIKLRVADGNSYLSLKYNTKRKIKKLTVTRFAPERPKPCDFHPYPLIPFINPLWHSTFFFLHGLASQYVWILLHLPN